MLFHCTLGIFWECHETASDATYCCLFYLMMFSITCIYEEHWVGKIYKWVG